MADKIQKVVSIPGMHCRSCEISLSNELEKIPGVISVEASLKKKAVQIIASKNDMPSDIEIARAVKRAGYKMSSDRLPRISKDPRIYKGIGAGFVLALLLLLALDTLGEGIDISKIGQDTVLLPLFIGGIAGISTCMALIGGLVAGLGAKYSALHPTATISQKFSPHLAFNAGRLVGFIVLGGMLGFIGSAFSFSPLLLGVLTIIAAICMFAIGLQLTGIFPRITTFTLSPKLARIFRLDAHRNGKYTHSNAVTLGALSFFLPCGFTQAMQLTAAASASWMDGALIMGLFALGTMPGLLLIGGATSTMNSRKSSVFFSILGALIITFAASNIVSGMKLLGFNGNTHQEMTTTMQVDSQSIAVTYLGNSRFDNSTIRIKADEEYVLRIYSRVTELGCMSTVMMPSLSDKPPQLLLAGKTLEIPIKATEPGTYRVICAMGVPFNMTIIAE